MLRAKNYQKSVNAAQSYSKNKTGTYFIETRCRSDPTRTAKVPDRYPSMSLLISSSATSSVLKVGDGSGSCNYRLL